jgi:hypothetical protein
MPSLKIKPEYANKLRELGIYNRYVSEVKNQWHSYGIDRNISTAVSWYTFIDNSFMWSESRDGFNYWNVIAQC